LGVQRQKRAHLDGDCAEVVTILTKATLMNPRSDRGFSLMELLVATCVLLVVMGIVMTALRQSMQQQQNIWNRTEMHSGVRGATELMQQEVGQAGRVASPQPITLLAPAVASASCDQTSPGFNATTVGVSSIKGLWATAGTLPASYALLTTFDGAARETVPLWSMTPGTPDQISACFLNAHAAGTLLVVQGAFGNGIIPPAFTAPGMPADYVPFTNGSTDTVLKMFGDINGDGNMVYVEYTCDTVAGKLYRTSEAYDSPTKKLIHQIVMLNNITTNPGVPPTPCFTYQVSPTISVQGKKLNFVLDVAITLTVNTQQVDAVTKVQQQETKALLNVSPRNVFNAWELAGIGYTDRIQSTPASVKALLGMTLS
jgi:prepilin-type N-terminal cleavage/methylation domain-containing protein